MIRGNKLSMIRKTLLFHRSTSLCLVPPDCNKPPLPNSQNSFPQIVRFDARHLFPFADFLNPSRRYVHPTLDEFKGRATPSFPKVAHCAGGAKMAKASWGGKIIAESNATVVVEGNQYFPSEAVKKESLKPSNHTSICPWK